MFFSFFFFFFPSVAAGVPFAPAGEPLPPPLTPPFFPAPRPFPFDFAGSPSISDELKERAKPKLAPRLTDEGELVLSSTKTRSREQNRSDCIERLAALLADAFQPVRVRKKTRPSRAQKQRRLDNKKRRGEKKKDRGQRWDE